MGELAPPLQVSFVMGVAGGIRPTARNVAHMAEQVPPVAHQWGVIGISRAQWTLLAAALALGGNVRVGLEDNFYLPDGAMARSNGDLVARAARMAADTGRRLATVAEARSMLGLT
jgi:3-keto-5-aminohexanoate cleavage enzyme